MTESELLNPYTKKEVEATFAGSRLHFAVSQSLFSSHQIDIGTRHLLRSLEERDLQGIRKVLDLGCGYGPLGVALGQQAASTADSEIHLVDRDALAVAFSAHNAERNHVANAKAYGSLGYDNVTVRDFDLIVSNIPGKAGEAVIRSLLLDARQILAPDGIVAIVIVNPLDALALEILSQPGIEIVLHRSLSAHTVIHYRFTEAGAAMAEETGWERGLYDRESLTFLLDELTVPMKTVRGLPEFDTLSYETILAYKALQDLGQEHYETISVFDPRQGLLPVILWRRFAPDHMALVARDLLSLRISALNLSDNGAAEANVGLHHQVPLLPPAPSPDLVVGILREDEGPEAIEAELLRAAHRMAPGAELLIIGGSTPITRVLKSKPLDRVYRTLKRRRGKGNSTAVLARR